MTREPEWDDQQRERMLQLAEYEAGVCPDCGTHHEMRDPERHFYQMETPICSVCAGIERTQRMLTEQDDENGKRLRDQAVSEPRPSDGRKLNARLLSPFEVAQAKARASRSSG